MIKANEAKEMVKVNIKADEDVRIAKIEKFLDTECDAEIRKAVENRQYSAFVAVPKDLVDYTATITAMLAINGYKVQVRHGYEPSILIQW